MLGLPKILLKAVKAFWINEGFEVEFVFGFPVLVLPIFHLIPFNHFRKGDAEVPFPELTELVFELIDFPSFFAIGFG